MHAKQFNNLQVGDTVTLSDWCEIYGCGYPSFNGRAYIQPGTMGTVGAVKVPRVYKPEGYFHCVDFPPDTPLYDHTKNRITYENRWKNEYRVAVNPENLK
jgi:hypothetical protein